MHHLFRLCLLTTLLFCIERSFARITRIEITRSEVFDDGRKFGDAGEYIKISGWFFGEVNPFDSLNSIIQDIQRAPRNVRGNVIYASQFVLVRPMNMSKFNGILFLSLPNRGNVFA